MNRLKTVVKEHALNEDAMLTRIRSKQHVIHKEEPFMSMKRLLPIGLAAALVLAVIASWSFFVPGVTAPVTTGTAAEKPAVSAYASVEITYDSDGEMGSIEILTDDNGKVESVIDDDGKEIDQPELKGMSVGQVIKWAKDQGFIVSSQDDDETIVLVTTALISETEEDVDEKEESFAQKIQDDIQVELADGELKVALIKATLREREKYAEEGQKIPLGLYIVNGMVDLNGDNKLDDETIRDVNNDGEPDKISDLIKYFKEHGAELDEEDPLSDLFAKRISILERKADRDEIKESRKAENEADESEEPEEDEDSGKPDSVPPVTPPGQAKKETVASGS